MLLTMRFEPPYAAMRQLVAAGRIGEVAQMAAQKSYKLGERPEWMRHRATFGGTIPYIGIHMVDLMRFIGGRELVEAVSFEARVGFPEMGDLENTTATLFRLDNGGMASLHMDYLRPEAAPTHGDDRLRLAGTRGVLEFQESAGLTLVTADEAPRAIQYFPPARRLFPDFLAAARPFPIPGLSGFRIQRHAGRSWVAGHLPGQRDRAGGAGIGRAADHAADLTRRRRARAAK